LVRINGDSFKELAQKMMEANSSDAIKAFKLWETRWGNGPAAAQPLARYSASEGALARRWSSLTDGVI
jgi:hypothetical protein